MDKGEGNKESGGNPLKKRENQLIQWEKLEEYTSPYNLNFAPLKAMCEKHQYPKYPLSITKAKCSNLPLLNADTSSLLRCSTSEKVFVH